MSSDEELKKQVEKRTAYNKVLQLDSKIGNFNLKISELDGKIQRLLNDKNELYNIRRRESSITANLSNDKEKILRDGERIVISDIYEGSTAKKMSTQARASKDKIIKFENKGKYIDKYLEVQIISLDNFISSYQTSRSNYIGQINDLRNQRNYWNNKR